MATELSSSRKWHDRDRVVELGTHDEQHLPDVDSLEVGGDSVSSVSGSARYTSKCDSVASLVLLP
eukprot:6203037-Pleurochrysis_carterae.AAC.4